MHMSGCRLSSNLLRLGPSFPRAGGFLPCNASRGSDEREGPNRPRAWAFSLPPPPMRYNVLQKLLAIRSVQAFEGLDGRMPSPSRRTRRGELARPPKPLANHACLPYRAAEHEGITMGPMYHNIGCEERLHILCRGY